MTEPLLEIKNLSVSLDKEKIINNLSFQIVEGEMLTILGPNGAGKSVLLRTLLGFLPYTGKIHWRKKIKLGYLPQGLTHLKMKEFPLTVLDFFRLKTSLPLDKEIESFLKMVGLEKNILSQKTGDLSGGQFQRMLIAWILISRPQIIFFDEPTSGIDIGGGETIYSLLNEIQKKEKLTVVLVTHDLNIIYKYSDHVLCLSHENYTCFGTPKEILSPQNLEKTFGMEIKFYEHIGHNHF